MTTTYIPSGFRLDRHRLRRTAVAVALALCVLLGVAVGPTVSRAVAHVRVGLSQLVENVRQPATLTREWRWQPRSLELDSMYGTGQRKPSPWIRNDVDRERTRPRG